MEKPGKPTIYVVLIERVSSTKQGLVGDSLDQQRDRNLAFLNTLSLQQDANIKVANTFQLTESASGEMSLQPLLKILEYFEKSKVKITYAVIKSIDRSTRGGSATYDYIKKQFASQGVTLIDTYGVISPNTVNTLGHLGVEYPWSVRSPSHINEMLVAEQAKTEVSDILTRMIGAEINYVREGYRVRPAPPGYTNEKVDTPHGKRTILVPHPDESSWFAKMFELRAQGSMSDAEIVKAVNDMGYHSRIRNKRDPQNKSHVIGKRGGIALTVKQYLRYISNPIYAGVNNEKWIEAPVKCKFPGLVSIETWNQANKGKVSILETDTGVSILKGTPKPYLIHKDKNNPLYPYKQYVTCAICRKPLLGSASTGKGGKPRPAYHCSRNHRSYRIKLQTFNETIEGFCKQVHFTDKFRLKFRTILLEEWDKRVKSLSQDEVSLHKLIADCEEEIQGIKDTVKKCQSTTLIRSLEDDLAVLENKKLNAEVKLGKRESEKLKVEVFIAETEYYMEHLDELLLDQAKPHKSAAMFGLLFSSTPTYDDLVNGTPQLAPIFKLKDAYEESEEQFVTSQGIEPCFVG